MDLIDRQAAIDDIHIIMKTTSIAFSIVKNLNAQNIGMVTRKKM